MKRRNNPRGMVDGLTAFAVFSGIMTLVGFLESKRAKDKQKETQAILASIKRDIAAVRATI